ncbi:diguanylate cyclase [Tropicimonas sediminicola]|uniref:diguanylate cyclase n=1 Tax=Tropicimonas sediminicola TaxID=1031541 RepID=A0A239EVJ9_9RHOB|nr:diguanylate cyclase [Tropicimonas sediminicola]SNS48617.1 response regulator receiver modulated diguanylate cyclase [Tropicimonas sediminicola]
MPGRILIVDDVATNRMILKAMLAGACYDVLQADGGAEALVVAERDRPDLILLDMSMPDIDGLSVCRKLKATPRTADIPVIIVTAHDDTPSKLAALEAGAEEFLSKPHDEMVLLARVRSLLRARSIEAELALRDGTSQALGFAEAGSEFVPAGRVCLVADANAEALSWKTRMSERLHDTVEMRSRETALAETGPTPDLFVVNADLGSPGGGLLLLSELRSRPETRHSGIIVIVPPGNSAHAAMALDLGASDVVRAPIDMDEMELRLKSMMARKRQADRLRRKVRDGLQMAVTDPLTGLYNRRYALPHLGRVRERALDTGRSFAVLMIDLDLFKSVNDAHGHGAGDRVLKTVTDRLQTNLRTVDLVARVGGEEFVVVLPEINPEAALNAAERLRIAISDTPITLPAGPARPMPVDLTQTVSIGLVIGGAAQGGLEDDAEQLLETADSALYRAKASGRNRVVLANGARRGSDRPKATVAPPTYPAPSAPSMLAQRLSVGIR